MYSALKKKKSAMATIVFFSFDYEIVISVISFFGQLIRCMDKLKYVSVEYTVTFL